MSGGGNPMALRKRLLLALALLLILITVSTTRIYRLLGRPIRHLPLQALPTQRSSRSLSVGYGEEWLVLAAPPHCASPTTDALVLFSVPITVLCFRSLAACLRRHDSPMLSGRRMQRHIDELTGHHIVCGLGDTGRHAVAELQKTMTPHVVVDISGKASES